MSAADEDNLPFVSRAQLDEDEVEASFDQNSQELVFFIRNFAVLPVIVPLVSMRAFNWAGLPKTILLQYSAFGRFTHPCCADVADVLREYALKSALAESNASQ